MEELYHPTTFYGYGFVISLPFLIALIYRYRIHAKKRILTQRDFKICLAIGLFCFAVLTVIILAE